MPAQFLGLVAYEYAHFAYEVGKYVPKPPVVQLLYEMAGAALFDEDTPKTIEEAVESMGPPPMPGGPGCPKPKLRRPKFAEESKQKIRDRQKKTEEGEFIDMNSAEVIKKWREVSLRTRSRPRALETYAAGRRHGLDAA